MCHEWRAFAAFDPVYEGSSEIVVRIVVWGRIGEVSDSVGGRVVLPPVIEAAAGLERGAAAGVAVSVAMSGTTIMPEVALPIPLLLAFAVGRGSRCYLDRCVHEIEAVADRGREPASEAL